MLGDDDLERLSEKLYEKLQRRHKDRECIYDIPPETHAAHHRLLEDMMSALDHINVIKWDIIRQIARVLFWTCVGTFMAGIAIKAGLYKP